MSNSIRSAMAVIQAYGDDGKLGFRKVAAKIGFGETITRYALQAFRAEHLKAAVKADVIEDGIVVAVLKKIPESVAIQICRIETKLGRTLSRTRAEKLVKAWAVVQQRESVKQILASMPVRSAPRSRRLPVQPIMVPSFPRPAEVVVLH